MRDDRSGLAGWDGFDPFPVLAFVLRDVNIPFSEIVEYQDL
jgi:hypothetical protein